MNMEIPAKSGKLKELERAAEETRKAHEAVLARRDPTGTDAPGRALIAEAEQTERAARAAAQIAHDRERIEAHERGDQLVRSAEFRKLLEGRAIAEAKRLEAVAALANAVELAGADGVKVADVFAPTIAERRDLQVLAIRLQAQGIDPKILPPTVREWIERHA